MYKHFIKRALDFIFALVLIVVLCWLFLILSILVAARLGKPVLFRQERPGRGARIFTIYKYRTMTDERDSDGELKPDEDRLTSFGLKLRNSSLDELPEIINILRGDMSFVGPRPLLVKYLPRYNERQARRHEVRPGLTGLAQVNGRNQVSWPQKFEYDVWYIDHMSFALDFKIVMRTVLAVLRREGISSDNAATMGEFLGNDDNA